MTSGHSPSVILFEPYAVVSRLVIMIFITYSRRHNIKEKIRCNVPLETNKRNIMRADKQRVLMNIFAILLCFFLDQFWVCFCCILWESLESIYRAKSIDFFFFFFFLSVIMLIYKKFITFSWIFYLHWLVLCVNIMSSFFGSIKYELIKPSDYLILFINIRDYNHIF